MSATVAKWSKLNGEQIIQAIRLMNFRSFLRLAILKMRKCEIIRRHARERDGGWVIKMLSFWIEEEMSEIYGGAIEFFKYSFQNFPLKII